MDQHLTFILVVPSLSSQDVQQQPFVTNGTSYSSLSPPLPPHPHHVWIPLSVSIPTYVYIL